MIRKTLTLVVLIGLLVFAGAAQAETSVTLRSSIEVNRAAIRLSDVFLGVPEQIDRDIAIAPSPGKSVTYDLRVLTKLAEQYRLDWQPQSLGDRIVLTRASTRITPDMIRTGVMRKIKVVEPKANEKMEVAFDNRNLGVDLPADRAPDFDLVNFDYDAQSHRFRSDLVAQTGGQPVTQTVTGRAIIKRDIPVLARRMVAGTQVGVADVAWVTVNDEKIGEDVLTTAEFVVGRELRHDQGEGEMFRARDLIAPRLVQRGTLVTLKVQTPLMLMTSQGRALQDGAKGETVRVTNTQSNRIIEGVVDAAGVVRVGMPSRLAFAE